MKYLKLFESFEDIDKICKEYGIENYTINPDGSIDVEGDLDIRYYKLTKSPIKFNKINGGFDCGNNKLISLERSPIEVNGGFYCYRNNLTTFQFCPKIIRGHLFCNYNNIKTFEHFPSYVKGEFLCNDNPIWYIWDLFRDTSEIELLNDFDIFRDEDTDIPAIIMDRLNDFLLTIGKDPVKK